MRTISARLKGALLLCGLIGGCSDNDRTTAMGPDFAPAPQHFSNAADCTRHLGSLIRETSGQPITAVARGPYPMGPDEQRAHIVQRDGAGHRIIEYRCLGPALSSRSWRRALTADAPLPTIESMAANAAWLDTAQ